MSNSDGGQEAAKWASGSFEEVVFGPIVAELPGVVVYKLSGDFPAAKIQFDLRENTVTDIKSGDQLRLKGGGHGGHGHYSLGNIKSGWIAHGDFERSSRRNATFYNITKLVKFTSGHARFLTREEFDFSRFANLFLAYQWGAARSIRPHLPPRIDREIVVVDTRPDKASEMNAKNGRRAT